VVSSVFIGNLPPATEKKINHKHEWTIEQLKEFVNLAPNYRDKAIITCMFQSGLAVNEITELNYGDIQEEFEEGTLPICLKLVRQKTGVEFKTFFGRDAVKYLRLYLQTRKELTSESPLFTKWGSEGRITTGAIQQRFSEITEELSFIKEQNKEGFNPCRPHSLRAAFKSKLINKISDELIEFWMGHTLGGVKDAYLNMPTEELRELYMDAEKYLAIEKASRDEITEEKGKKLILSQKVEQKVEGLEETISGLQQRVGEQKQIIKGLVTALHEVEDRLSLIEQDRENVEIKKTLTEPTEEEAFHLKEELKKLKAEEVESAKKVLNRK